MASSAATSTAPRRRPSAEWGAVSRAGTWTVEEVGKHELVRRTGLPARDLRALDPNTAPSYSCYPSSSGIAARDRAVVVSLDGVRAVVTTAEVLVPGPRDPAVAPLVRELPVMVATGSDGGGLPFEFRALEACLQLACKSLEHETCALEKEAYPALDELTSKVSTLNLERVRQIKSRLVAVSGRVQKVRDELERLLDDDAEMVAMHLTEKLAHYRTAAHSSRLDTENEPAKFYQERGDGSSEGGNGSETPAGFCPKIDELENLLEAYFVQVDGTLNKLSTLREYVDDTEDYINIMLDDKQNQLLQMGIMLSTATLVVSCAIAVAGVFGMNIRIPFYDAATTAVFWQTTGGIVGAGAAVYLVALLCYRRSGILQ